MVAGGLVAGGWVASGAVAAGAVAEGACAAGAVAAGAGGAVLVGAADAGTGDVGLPANRGAPESVVAVVAGTTVVAASPDAVCAVVVHVGGCAASALTPMRNADALSPNASRRPPEAA